jgi:hypothetical protein
MRLKIIFLSISIAFFTGCNEVDAFECGHVWPLDDSGNQTIPIEQSYMYCVNQKTNQVKRIPITELYKCIRDESQKCKWVATDITERELFVKAHKDQCSKE